jgi:beta-lactam-binding protein with PASTA domain
MSKLVAYLKTKSFRNTILLGVGSVIVVVLIAFFSLSFYTNHGSGIPVPKVLGLSVDNATRLLTDQGFEYQVDSIFRDDYPPGTVIEQDPDAGTNVKENRVIYLTMVTRLAPPVTLPNIEQTPYVSAAATLASYGLKIKDTVYSADIARDMVLEVRFSGQPIKPGTKLPKGSALELVLGDGAGASEVEIPDLVGLDMTSVKFSMGQIHGLSLGIIQSKVPITDTSNAVVISQSPMKTDSATKVPIGTKINLVIGPGKKDGAN